MGVQNDDHHLLAQRREKLNGLRQKGAAFPNDFQRNALAGELHAAHEQETAEHLESQAINCAIAGRMMSKRVMGKASFAHLQDSSGRIQIFVQRDGLADENYAEFKTWDVGDIVAVNGRLFKTRTGELTVKAERVRLLVKSLRPLPEKFHGLSDQEQRYRQRYLDLIMNASSRDTFRRRSAVISSVRRYFDARGYMEVETPMMQPIPGGAVARPFTTFHNALDMSLYLRIAPELYLKRLVVGGFEKVYEINRNFRNEGLSARHNPEFTMLEFYQAYATYHDLMDHTEDLLRHVATEVLGSLCFEYQGVRCDWSQDFSRMTLREAIFHYNSHLLPEQLLERSSIAQIASELQIDVQDAWGPGKIELEIFEKTVEHQLVNPVFITAFPTEVSPLARRNDQDPRVSDRFELFVCGREIANGFSELNDYEDQAQRFKQQVREKEAGDEEAMHYDDDYVTALEYGLPPTAGEGIGIDRLVMLLTNAPSIRDVLLFPHMRPRSQDR